jgi:hypothetical protein
MTPAERHAELVYTETLFEKVSTQISNSGMTTNAGEPTQALLGILYSGDWLAFLKEALNLRTTMNIYRDLGKFVEQADADALARGDGPEDSSIDQHFRSGVYLGVGASHLVLSMMPARVLSLVEMFGYKGDRETGLEYLMRAGGWTKDKESPDISVSVCLLLFTYHWPFLDQKADGLERQRKKVSGEVFATWCCSSFILFLAASPLMGLTLTLRKRL